LTELEEIFKKEKAKFETFSELTTHLSVEKKNVSEVKSFSKPPVKVKVVMILVLEILD